MPSPPLPLVRPASHRGSPRGLGRAFGWLVATLCFGLACSPAPAQISRTFDAEATEPGAIEGRLLWPAGRGPAVGAVVRLTPSDQAAPADTAGRFDFSAVAPGTYTLSVAGAGLVTVRVVDVVVKPAHTTSLGVLELASVFAPDDVHHVEEMVVNADQLSLLQLRVFTVSVRDDGRYMPAEVTTGARVATRVDEVPYAVNVITSEFFKDFSFFELTEEFAYASSLTGFDDAGSFTLRGFAGNIVLRNGFARLGLAERTSIDRVEVIKGPAAAIYGQTFPGGLINFITKKPAPTPRESVTLAAGSFDLARTELEATGPVPLGAEAPKLFYLFTASGFGRNYEGPAQASSTRTLSAAITYKLGPDTNLTAAVDYNRRHTDLAALPYVYDPRTARYTGFAWDLAKRYYASPTDWTNRTIYSYDAGLEHQFNDWLSLRVAGNVYRSPRFGYSSVNSSSYDPATRALVNRGDRSTFNFLEGDGQSGALDLLARYRLGRTEQKTLLTVDYYKNVGKRPAYSSRTADVPPTLSVDAPVFVPDRGFSDAAYAATRFRDDYNQAIGTFLRQQISLFDDKLIGMAGLRFDYVHQHVRDQLVVPVARADFHVDNLSKQLGVSYRVAPGLMAYANRTESFVPNNSSLIVAATQPLANQTGLGYEAGLKATLLDEHLTFTTDVYRVGLERVLVTEIDPKTLLPYLAAQGDQDAHGFEFDGNWRAGHRLQMIASYGYTAARTGNQGTDLDLAGRAPRATPRHTLGAAVTFQATRALELNASLRYYSRFTVDTSGGLAGADGLVRSNDGRRDIFAPAYAVWNAGASYRWSTGPRRSQVVRLAVKNALDRRYIVVGVDRTLGDPRGLYLTYTLER